MEPLRLIRSLEQFPNQLDCLLSECDATDLVWKPNSDNWSILEIVCHLADEEVDDFRMRLRLTLTQPRQTWPPIDPVRAATDRNYAAQNMTEVLERFRHERRESIEWLKSLGKANWHASYEHPKLGTIRAGDLLPLGQRTTSCTCDKLQSVSSNACSSQPANSPPITPGAGPPSCAMFLSPTCG